MIQRAVRLATYCIGQERLDVKSKLQWFPFVVRVRARVCVYFFYFFDIYLTRQLWERLCVCVWVVVCVRARATLHACMCMCVTIMPVCSLPAWVLCTVSPPSEMMQVINFISTFPHEHKEEDSLFNIVLIPVISLHGVILRGRLSDLDAPGTGQSKSCSVTALFGERIR